MPPLSIVPNGQSYPAARGGGGESAGAELRMSGLCPVASMYGVLMKKPVLALLLVPLGLALILAGVLIVVEPRIALWLNAGLFVVLGAWLLLFAAEIRAGAREDRQHKLSILG